MSDEREVQTIEGEIIADAIVPVTKTSVQRFAQQFDAGLLYTEEWMRNQWVEKRDAWLRHKFKSSNSENTRKAYELASMEWIQFVSQIIEEGQPLQLWQVTTDHVEAWQAAQLEQGRSAATINQRLAICSSWYTYVLTHPIFENGVEKSLFIDIYGRDRRNPFSVHAVGRLKQEKYGKARVLNAGEVCKLLIYLEERQEQFIGSRNYALIMTYLLMGYRNAEVVNIRWGDIREHKTQKDAYVIAWEGKGGKAQVDPFPVMLYAAYIKYLRIHGRWAPGTEHHIQPHEYVFRPIVKRRKTAGNLRNVDHTELDPGRPISESTVRETIRSTLRRAGIKDAGNIRVHDLRHTFAHAFRENDPDIEKLRDRLHHSNIAVTGIYVATVLSDPIDDHSQKLYQYWKQGSLFEG